MGRRLRAKPFGSVNAEDSRRPPDERFWRSVPQPRQAPGEDGAGVQAVDAVEVEHLVKKVEQAPVQTIGNRSDGEGHFKRTHRWAVDRLRERLVGVVRDVGVLVVAVVERVGNLDPHAARRPHRSALRARAVGHNRGEDGTLSIARLWRRSRGDNPGGGIASSVADQLRWARFHLGDGRAESGAHVLPAEVLHRMKAPTVALRGSNLGDAIGIGWFLREVDGVRTVRHGASANGQFAELLTVAERGFAVVSLSNAGPDGVPFNQAVVRWALKTYLGLIDTDPEPIPYDQARAQEIAGHYQNDAQALIIAADVTGLTLEVDIKPEIRAAADKELPPGYPPAAIGAARRQGRVHPHRRRNEGAARLLHPRRERRGRGSRPRRPVVQPEGRRGDMVELFMTTVIGAPGGMVAGMRQSPMWPGFEAVAHTLLYDGVARRHPDRQPIARRALARGQGADARVGRRGE